MKKVEQTKFSIFFADGKRLTYGNCLVACVASLLEESIDEVPNFYTFYGLEDNAHKKKENPMWMSVLNLWLENKHQKRISANGMEVSSDEEFVIIRGNSLRGKPHCCIFKNSPGGFVPHFDPHPTSQFLRDQHYYYSIKKI